jgi:hypothetical protein
MVEDIFLTNRFQSILDKIISFSENGVMQSKSMNQLDEFDGLWSQEDRTNLNDLRKRITIDAEGRKILTAPLTQQEKAWAANLVWQIVLAERCI